MTRIKILDRDGLNAEQGEVYDEISAAGNPVGGPFWAYIRQPKLMRLTSGLGTYLRESDLGARERQIVVLAVVRFWDGNYPWAVQVRASLAAGLDQAIIDAINARQDPPITDPRERAAWRVATELVSTHRLSDETYAAAEAAFGVDDLVNLVAAVGHFSMVCCTANAFDITPPDNVPARLAD